MKYIVFSNYINAWSIKKGLEQLGKQLDVCYLERKNNVINHTIEEIPSNSTLFFTEENSLKKYKDSSSHKFYPNNFPSKLLDDKYSFANFLLDINEIPIPCTDIYSTFEYPFFLKAKHSWKSNVKLPRGFICESESDFEIFIKRIIDNNLNLDFFFKQKLLSSPLQNNISTSGYFDSDNNKRNIMIVTQKALGDDEKIATGVVVKTIPDPNNLIERTVYILNKLKYKGPFELEFFYEEKDQQYYVLELNPRFWMQHGLFVDFYDNAIIKRYLNEDTPRDWVENGKPKFKEIVWVDNLFYLKSIFKKEQKVVRSIRNLKGEKKFYPSTIVSFKFFYNLLINKVMN